MPKPVGQLRRHARLPALSSANSVNVRALLSVPMPLLIGVRQRPLPCRILTTKISYACPRTRETTQLPQPHRQV